MPLAGSGNIHDSGFKPEKPGGVGSRDACFSPHMSILYQAVLQLITRIHWEHLFSVIKDPLGSEIQSKIQSRRVTGDQTDQHKTQHEEFSNVSVKEKILCPFFFIPFKLILRKQNKAWKGKMQMYSGIYHRVNNITGYSTRTNVRGKNRLHNARSPQWVDRHGLKC